MVPEFGEEPKRKFANVSNRHTLAMVGIAIE
jgi:hypothetical protein